MMEDSGRVPSEPGSREPSPTVSAASGFDPSRKDLWPLCGYAPGGYMGRCRDCGLEMWNADKRASQCLNCAILSAKAGLEELRAIKADERGRREALRVLIDRLPAFSSHWPAERVDQWFVWFFDLLRALEPRARDSDGSRDGRDREAGLDGEAATARAPEEGHRPSPTPKGPQQ